MKPINLKFWKEIKGGKKSHYIFTQEDTFFVLTDMDKEERGNFYAISLEEINCVRNQLCSNLIPETFQCSKIFNFIDEIKGQKGYIKNKNKEPRFITDRLTRICYILTGMNLLKLEKYSGSVFFTKKELLHYQISKINSENENLESQYIPSKKRDLNDKPIKIEPIKNANHSKINLPKRKKPLTKCPYCNTYISEKKYEKHIKFKCPKTQKNNLNKFLT